MKKEIKMSDYYISKGTSLLPNCWYLSSLWGMIFLKNQVGKIKFDELNFEIDFYRLKIHYSVHKKTKNTIPDFVCPQVSRRKSRRYNH